MLAPDVVTARTSLRAEARCRAGKVTDNKFEAALEAGLNHVNTCRQVNIVLPGLQADRLEQVLTDDTDHYQVTGGFDIGVFWSREFQQCFLSSGQLVVTGAGLRLAGGKLELSLPAHCPALAALSTVIKPVSDKDGTVHYQTLLPGPSSPPSLESCRVPGPVRAAWLPPEPSICPSSLAQALVNRDMQVSVAPSKVSRTVVESLVPELQDCLELGEVDWQEELDTWLGGVCLGLPTTALVLPHNTDTVTAPLLSLKVLH